MRIIETRGGFQVKERRTAYENPWIRVIEDKVVRPDGNDGLFGVIEFGEGRGGVSFLPVDDDHNILLVREFMYAVNRFDVEVAGGGTDKGEDALASAKREMHEELGLKAKEWIDLGSVAHATSIMRAGTHLYMARGFDMAELKPEAGLEIVSYPLKDAIDLVMRGEIQASTTCCIILKAARFLGL